VYLQIALGLWLFAGLPCFAEPPEEEKGMSAFALYLEQYYLNPDPDFSLFLRAPASPNALFNQSPYGNLWLYEGDVLENLSARHPDLGDRLSAGAAYRIKTYDELLASAEKILESNGGRLQLSQAVLKSYVSALADQREQEAKRTKLEAETLAYEAIREKGRYPLGSNTNTWDMRHQRMLQPMIDRLMDEERRRKKDDDVLSEKSLNAWKKKVTGELESWWSDTRASELQNLQTQWARKLPFDYTQHLRKARDRWRDALKQEVGSLSKVPVLQREYQARLHAQAVNEAKDYARVKETDLGSDGYRALRDDTAQEKRFQWVRDLQWWDHQQNDEGNPAELERQRKVQEQIQKRYQKKSSTDLAFSEETNLLEGSDGKVLQGVGHNHPPRNSAAQKSGSSSSSGIIFRMKSLRRSESGSYWMSYHPPTAPQEFLWGRIEDWDPKSARKYSGAREKTEFYLGSSSVFYPVDGMVSIPRPEGYDVDVEILRNGQSFRGKDVEVWETPDGYLFAKVPGESKNPVKLTLGYVPSKNARMKFEQDPTRLPVLTERERGELGRVASELEGMGEHGVSAALRRHLTAGNVTPQDISDSIYTHSLYSYVPAAADLKSAGKLAMFSPFLDPEGRLCFQCSGAADLLAMILNRTLVDHPNWKAKTGRVILRDSNTWILYGEDLHRWVRFGDGRTSFVLDPTPPGMDPRNPPDAKLPRSLSPYRVPKEQPTSLLRSSALPRPLDKPVTGWRNQRELEKEANGESSHAPKAEEAHGSKSTTGAKSQGIGRFFFWALPGKRDAPSSGTEREGGEGIGIVGGTGGAERPAGGRSVFLPEGWDIPFEWLRAWGGALSRKESDGGVQQKSEEESVTQESAPEEKPAPAINEPPLSPPHEKSKNPDVRLAEMEKEDPLKKLAEEELKARRRRNEVRRKQLAELKVLQDTLYIELESAYTKPVAPQIRLPHRDAVAGITAIRDYLANKPGAPSFETIQKEIGDSKKSAEELVKYYHEPGRRLRPDRVREIYLGHSIPAAAIEILNKLQSTPWSRFESEDINDVFNHVRRNSDPAICPKVEEALGG